MCSYVGGNGDTNSVLQICPGTGTADYVLALGPRVADGCEGGEFDVVPACDPWVW